ncbi:MAG: hypothetical protein J6T60_15730 [Bacteroidales bacterium]|nr:hypothetical protein [Bacteroidales bacterium]
MGNVFYLFFNKQGVSIEISVFPGFSFGGDVRLKSFSVQYSRQCVSPAASANMFTVELMIGKMIGR